MRILPVALIVTVGVVGAGDVNCTELGFDPTILKCDTCVRLRRNLELQKEAESIEEDCRKCCNLVDASGQNEIYEKAELVTSRMAMEARQDLSDFVKRKVPELKKRGYEITVTIRYVARTVLALTKLDDGEVEGEGADVDYLEVYDWKTDELVEYIALHLKRNEKKEDDDASDEEEL